MLDDLALVDPPHVEGDDRRRGNPVVPAMRNYEIVLADHPRPGMPEACRQGTHQVAQSRQPIGPSDRVLNVIRRPVAVNSPRIPLIEQFVYCPLDKSSRAHGYRPIRYKVRARPRVA
jgi:hypothetical protein